MRTCNCVWRVRGRSRETLVGEPYLCRPPPYHAAADLCESVWRRRMAPALSTTYMVGLALIKYVKEQQRVPVLKILVRFLEDEITKTEVHT